MNSAVSDAALIGLDWGTSSLRAILISQAGDVLDVISTSSGIMNVEDRDFASVFHGLIAPWIADKPLPVIASGMITSRNGWVETPYLPVPADAAALAGALTLIKTDQGIDLHFVTGMTADHNGAPDVMRGEETQIVGAVATGLSDGLFVMPGTHSKWISVADGTITNFATYMTGEMFGVLSKHSILGAFISEGPFHRDSFVKGASEALADGANLLHDLFHARTLPLFGRIDEAGVADYLSGMLIGAEIKAATNKGRAGDLVTIVGRGDLAERYEVALDLAGLKSQRAPDNIVAGGHYLIAKAAELI